jgi:hypothetical protein
MPWLHKANGFDKILQLFPATRRGIPSAFQRPREIRQLSHSRKVPRVTTKRYVSPFSWPTVYGAHEVDDVQAPGLSRIVPDLASHAALPMFKVYVVDNDQPNTFDVCPACRGCRYQRIAA